MATTEFPVSSAQSKVTTASAVADYARPLAVVTTLFLFGASSHALMTF